MTANELRAALRTKIAAFLIGAAVATVCAISPADAGVRAAVGKPLQAAQSLAASGNYSAAMSKVREAEGVGGLSAEESRDVAQMKNYIEAKQGGSGPKAKFSNDYRSQRWSAVLSDADEMHGQLDATDMAAVATAYYKLDRNSDCVHYIKEHFGNGGGKVVLEIERACAFGAGDDATQTEALEQLVATTNDPKYWGDLLNTAQRTKGVKDHQTLDIYRLKLLTGNMSGGDKDYSLLAKLALEFGFNGEAQAVLQKGIDAKLLTGDSITRLMNMAKTQAAQGAATWNQRLAAAKAAPTGDDLVKLGEDLTGQGRAKDAIDLVQQGIAKGKGDANNAQMRLGQAYLASGQKGDATRAFGKVKGTPGEEIDARLWTLYARK
jgi:hypothetical protein